MSSVRDFLATLLEGCHTDTAAQDMPQSLGTLAQLVEGHDGGNGHLHDVAAQVDGLNPLLPCLDFLLGVCLFGKRLDGLGVEGQFRLTLAQTVVDGLTALTEPLEGVGRPDLLPEYEVGDLAGPLAGIAHRRQFSDSAVARLVHMLEHGVDMESVEVLDVLFQGPYHLGQLPQLVRSHLVDHKLAGLLIDDLLCGVDQGLEPLHEVRRQVGVVSIQAVHTCVRLQCSFQTVQTLHKFLVGLCRRTATKLLLTGKVDGGEEGDHGSFQHIRDMLHHILVIRMQYPVRQGIHILTQALTILLDGVGLVPAVSPAFQSFLVLHPLLLLYDLSGLLQNTLQHRLVFHRQNLSTCGLDLVIEDMHPVQGFLCRLTIHLGAKLLLLVDAALLVPLLLKGFQFAQTLLENVQGIPFSIGQIIDPDLSGGHSQYLTVRQGVGALLILFSQIFTALLLHGIFFHAGKPLLLLGI